MLAGKSNRAYDIKLEGKTRSRIFIITNNTVRTIHGNHIITLGCQIIPKFVWKTNTDIIRHKNQGLLDAGE